MVKVRLNFSDNCIITNSDNCTITNNVVQGCEYSGVYFAKRRGSPLKKVLLGCVKKFISRCKYGI